MAIEFPPLNCGDNYGGGGDVNVSVSAIPLEDGGVGIGITITPSDSPISINIVPFFPFILPGINWDFIFGTSRIHEQKQAIQDFYTPLFRYAHSAWGYALRDNHALQFQSDGVQRMFAQCPDLAALWPVFYEDACTIEQCVFGDCSSGGGQKRFVNQFIANACINQWTVQQSQDLWDAIVQAVQPLPQCVPQCLTATQVTRYLLRGYPEAPGMRDFLCHPENWDTDVLYCFPATFQRPGCPPPVTQPGPQPSPQPTPQPGTCHLPDGTPVCCLPAPQPSPQPVPQPSPQPQPQPSPQPQPQPQPQPCPPACQSQIDALWQCCENALNNINHIWQSIDQIWNAYQTFYTEVWQTFQTVWNVLNDIDVRIETHIENYYITIIKPYIDAMCERCRQQSQPPPDSNDLTECERGRKYWGLWAECWLEDNTPTLQNPFLFEERDIDPAQVLVDIWDADHPEWGDRTVDILTDTLDYLNTADHPDDDPYVYPYTGDIVIPYGFVPRPQAP